MRGISEASFHILLTLADNPRHGLGIADEVEAASDGRVRLGPGVLYTTLKKLLAAGLIAETAGRPHDDDGDPRRRYYRLQPTGLQALRSESTKWARALQIAHDKEVLESEGRS